MRKLSIALAALALSACSTVDLLPAEYEAKIKRIACDPTLDPLWVSELGRPLGPKETARINLYRALECPDLPVLESGFEG